MTIHEAGGPTPFPASVAGPSGKVRGDMNHRTGLIETELAAVAVIRDSGEIVIALRPRGLLTATDRQVLAMHAAKTDATARTARRPRRSTARITRRSPRRTATYSSVGTSRARALGIMAAPARDACAQRGPGLASEPDRFRCLRRLRRSRPPRRSPSRSAWPSGFPAVTSSRVLSPRFSGSILSRHDFRDAHEVLGGVDVVGTACVAAFNERDEVGVARGGKDAPRHHRAPG